MQPPIALTSAAVALALLAAGCGSSSDGTAQAPTSAQPTDTDTDTDTAQDKGKGEDKDDKNAKAGKSSGQNQPTSIPVPSYLAFDATTIDGDVFEGASLAGEDAVLFFWAPWCTVCRGEAPGVAAVAADFSGEADVVGVAGLSSDLDAKKEFVSATGSGGMTHLDDDDGSLYAQFGVVSQYTYAFLDDSGQMEIVVGPLSEDELRKRTQALVAS